MARDDDQPVVVRRGLPRAVIALGVTSFFGDVGSEMIFPLLPAFLATLGATPTFLGLVEGVADATSSLLKLASGYLADRTRHRKPLVLLGYAIASLARPVVAFATAPWHVLAVRVTDRVGKGLRTAPRDALIAGAVSGDETGRAFGFHRAMDHTGAVVGPMVATALLALGVPVRTVFLAALVPGLLSVLAVATVREPTTDVVMRAQPSATEQRLPASLRSYFGILLFFSLFNASDAFLLLRARELGVPVTWLPMLWTFFHVAKVLSSYLGGDFSDRVARSKVVAAGWMVYAATYVAFAHATEAWHVWALFAVYGSYYGLTEPTEKALVKDLSPAALRGRAYGYYNFIIGIAAIPAGAFMGFMWEKWSPAAALQVGALVGAVSAVVIVLWAARHELL